MEVSWGALGEAFPAPPGTSVVPSPASVPQTWVPHDRFPWLGEESSRLRPPDRAAAAFLAAELRFIGGSPSPGPMAGGVQTPAKKATRY